MTMNSLLQLLLFSFFLSASATIAFRVSDNSSQVYISPFGSDNGAGTKSDPFETLSAALNAVTPGGTIFVLTGTYSGPKNFLTITKNVTIQSADPSFTSPEKYVFDALGDSQIRQYFTFSTGLSVVFKGLGFHNSNQNYPSIGIITIVDASVSIINCRFWQNTNAVASQGQQTTLENVQFVNNQASILLPYRSGDTRPVRVVANNISVEGGYSGLSVATGPSEILGTSLTFRNLSVGITIGGSSYNFDIRLQKVSVVSCIEGVYADGLSNGYRGRIILDEAVISNNTLGSNLDGAGVHIGSRIFLGISQGYMENNKAAGRGGAIYCGDQGSVNLQTVVVSGNSASNGGAGWCSANCAFLATDVQSQNNSDKSNTSPCLGL